MCVPCLALGWLRNGTVPVPQAIYRTRQALPSVAQTPLLQVAERNFVSGGVFVRACCDAWMLGSLDAGVLGLTDGCRGGCIDLVAVLLVCQGDGPLLDSAMSRRLVMVSAIYHPPRPPALRLRSSYSSRPSTISAPVMPPSTSAVPVAIAAVPSVLSRPVPVLRPPSACQRPSSRLSKRLAIGHSARLARPSLLFHIPIVKATQHGCAWQSLPEMSLCLCTAPHVALPIRRQHCSPLARHCVPCVSRALVSISYMPCNLR